MWTSLLVGVLLGSLASKSFKDLVCEPGKDICGGLCHQFHNDDACLQSDDDNEDNDDADKDGALMEARALETQKLANEIKQHVEDVTSMRARCRTVMEEAKTATKHNVADKEMVKPLVANCCQNMELPFFGKDLPGDTCCCTPKTINLFGVVDCNSSEKDILCSCACGEDHGGKGRNNVALLLMKCLEDRGLLDGTTQGKLSML
jgi:hypothetical protein